MFFVANASVTVASAKPSRLPPGRLDTPDCARTRDLLRRWYLGTINVVAPVVLDDLASDAMARFQEATTAGIDLTAWLHDGLVLLVDDVTRPGEVVAASFWKLRPLDDAGVPLTCQEPEAVRLRESLRAWARRWGLPWETWCIGQAVYCLGEWKKHGTGELGNRQWHCLAGGVGGDPRDIQLVQGDAMVRQIALRQADSVLTDEAPAFSLVAPGSDTRMEHPTATEARIRSHFEAQLRTYLDSRERSVPVEPLVTAPEVREPEEHLAWLVRYNVLKESFGEISRQTGRSRSTVSDAIRRMANLAGIVLRDPDPPGRPPAPKSAG